MQQKCRSRKGSAGDKGQKVSPGEGWVLCKKVMEEKIMQISVRIREILIYIHANKNAN